MENVLNKCVWRAGFENTPRAPRMELDIRLLHPGHDSVGQEVIQPPDSTSEERTPPPITQNPGMPPLLGNDPKTNTALCEVTSEHRSKLGLPAVALWHAGVDHGARLVTLPGPAGTHPNPPSHARGPAAA